MVDDMNNNSNSTYREKKSAGPFSTWLHNARNALQHDTGIDVACGECIGCCTSSYFIHIRADEAETRSKIPKLLLFPAPGLPDGNVLMGYDEHGRCPMLINQRCSIYEYRPLTCRTYDCRIFPATGLTPGGDEKSIINQQIKKWQFDYPTEQDRNEQKAVIAAVSFLQEHAKSFADGFLPNITTQLAMLAIKVYDVFLNTSHGLEHEAATDDIIIEVVSAYKNFDATSVTPDSELLKSNSTERL
jgi:Fe-S-cluster containining protein